MLEAIKHEPPTLAEFFGQDKVDFREVDLSEYAHLIIDAQKEFADPTYWPSDNLGYRGTTHTHDIASNIARYAPHLREQGLTQIFIYLEKDDRGFKKSYGGPHLIKPDYELDIIIPKTLNDAFTSSSLQNILNRTGKKNLLVSGFNADRCIKSTVISGLRRNFKIALLCDGIGQDSGPGKGNLESALDEMEEEGALKTNSDKASVFIEKLRLTA